MKSAHWVMFNKSGMNRVAESMVLAEKKIGIDAHLVDVQNDAKWGEVEDADVHISHTHFPDVMRNRVTKPLRIAWVGHGTPEHVFKMAVEAGSKDTYGFADGVMLLQHWLRTADAIVTFWPRHQAIYQSMCDKHTTVDCIPLGVDKAFWAGGVSRGKYQGAPSLFSCENAHDIKWPLDILIAWPWIYPKHYGACLHVAYLPNNIHRWFFPLVNANGSSYSAHISGLTWGHEDLRNILKSVDYYIGLVRYGDFNRMSMEAGAAGLPLISYRGNPYADYWITEGDQRQIAEEVLDIIKGVTPKREKLDVPSDLDMANAMKQIYERIL